MASTFDAKTKTTHTTKTASTLKSALAPKAKAKQQKKWIAQSKCPRTLRFRNLKQVGSLAEMKLKLRQMFPSIKLVSFLHSRKNQLTLNGWLVFHDAKGLIDTRIILETDRPFGLEIMREGDAAPLQITAQKMEKKVVRKPVSLPIAENLVMKSDILYFPSKVATWFD